MKSAPDTNRLLDDVLAETAPADFRGVLLGETLRLARRRRWVRHSRRAAVAVAMACVTGWLVWRGAVPGVATVSSVASCDIVRTQPLAAAAIVSTSPLDAARPTSAFASVDVISTVPGAGDFRVIDDELLLALAAPRLAALVRVGPGEQELIFVEGPVPANPP
jgi:hypothetical protein